MSETVPYDENYNFFKTLTGGYANGSPQNQGLTSSEFSDALKDPDVSLTLINSENAELALPQLGPVTANQWLNDSYFQNRL